MAFIDIHKACDFLKTGQPVAIPTETVYGLAAPINNQGALEKIFKIKKRPLFDPLIVHVKNLEQAQKLAHWDFVSETLAKSFWPGPLTLILEKKQTIDSIITASGTTVAIRQPKHPLTQGLLEKLNIPIAAPSANRFGRTSPTTAEHVEDEFQGEIPIVDGGPCEKGIESTVLQVSQIQKKVFILRPGVISSDDLEKVLKENNLAYEVSFQEQSHSPGHLKNHYQPSVPFVLLHGCQDLQNIDVSEVALFKNAGAIQEWQLPDEPQLAARKMYSDLREFSKSNTPIYLKIKTQWLHSENWRAIIDRLNKACHNHGKISQNGKIILTEKT